MTSAESRSPLPDPEDRPEPATVEVRAVPPEHDPEFDRPPQAVPPVHFDAEPQAYQRLVVNPLLAAALIVAWVAAARLWLSRLQVLVSVPVVAVAAYRLLHVHCLDCGTTVRLSRWRDHACHKVVARWQQGRRRRLRGPAPPVQLVLWMYALLAAAIATLLMLGR